MKAFARSPRRQWNSLFVLPPPAVPVKFDQQRRILVGCDGVITLLRHFADNTANKRANTDEEKKHERIAFISPLEFCGINFSAYISIMADRNLILLLFR